MNSEIVMPKIGLTMTEGKIVEWRKSVGEPVRKDEVLFVFETEKVTFEVEAQQDGALIEITADVDDVVPVGAKVGALGNGAGAAAPDGGAPAKKTVEKKPAEAAIAAASTSAANGAAPATRPAPAAAGGKLRATPLARKLARQGGLALESVSFSGERIRAADVRAALTAELTAVPSKAAPAQPHNLPSLSLGETRLVKPTGMRRVIAERMLASTQETAQAYMTASIDVTKVRDARTALTPQVEAETGVRPSLTDMFMKIAASAVLKHPVMNTRWTEEGVLWFEQLHMGLATALDDGLVVPVIRDIGAKSVGQIAAARHELVSRARDGSLTPDEMQGGTFTLSSLGMFGVEEFNSILNQPEAAILAIGAIIDTPVAVEGRVEIRPMMKVTLTYDHRLIDGAKAGGFMQTLKAMVENPFLVFA